MFSKFENHFEGADDLDLFHQGGDLLAMASKSHINGICFIHPWVRLINKAMFCCFKPSQYLFSLKKFLRK